MNQITSMPRVRKPGLLATGWPSAIAAAVAIAAVMKEST